MKNSREFEIAWMGLKPGVHTFQYSLDDAFMQAKSAPADLSGWKTQVGVRFDKHESFFMLHFDVGGTVMVPCDRCGDEFELRLWDEFDLLVKLSGESDDHQEDEDADVVFIPRHETVIDISDWIYEFVMLSMPLQRIHPDLPDGSPGCNSEALKLLGNLAASEEGGSETEQPANSIWKGLEALREKGQDSPPSNNSKSSDHAKS